MSWFSHLNPAPWRDEDEHRRMACPPTSGVGAALRTTFPIVPLPTELQKMLDKLR